MKRILSSLALVLALSSTTHALTIDYETISGTRRSAQYGWTFAYDVGFIDNAIRVDVDLAFVGAPLTDALWSTWERGIESIWSTDRFSVPILFNVDWVSDTSAYDYLVKVQAGSGRSDMGHWYSQDFFAAHTAAHEFGHMIGRFDEYFGSGLDPETHLITNGLMGNSRFGETLDFYYDPFLNWYEAKLEAYEGDGPVPTPEPSSWALLVIGLLGVVVVKKRQEV